MSGDLRIENTLIQVRSKLKENGIKLWLSPYYVEGIGVNDNEIENLAREISPILNIPFDYCRMALCELQNNALDQLKARAEFAETGLATIKIRAPRQVGGTSLITVSIKLSELGKSLQDMVASKLLICPTRVKLICAGKVVLADKTLEQQNIKNNQQIMAITLEISQADAIKENETMNIVQKAREDAQMLINQKRNFMEMEDQKGNAIHLPPEERKSLMMALAMHEKGKAELKKGNHNVALLLFLEADNEFSRCNSTLLQSVDNFALLNLDIVWCYLCLKSVAQLPDAEERLRICEENFRRSYGENMNRVVALKGNSGNERALIMRLHLLQAVLYFHHNRRPEARNMILLAETELNQLKSVDQGITTLLEMGYSETEARIGLRACNGDIEQAIGHIIEMKSTRKKARERSRMERKQMKKVHASKDDTWINPRLLTDLVEMGFPNELCAVALRSTNNNLSESIDMLQHDQSALEEKFKSDFIPDSTIVDKLVEMGYARQLVEMCLQFTTNNMDEAIIILLRMQNDGTYQQLLNNLASNDTLTTPSTSNSSSNLLKKIENERLAMEAFERFSEGVINNDDDQYLDISLVVEENILEEYKKYLLT